MNNDNFDFHASEEKMGKIIGELIEATFETYNSELFGLECYKAFYKKLVELGELARVHLEHAEKM